MDSTLHKKVAKTSMKRYPKVKRALINRHRKVQNKQILNELQQLMLSASAGDDFKPVSKNFQKGFLNAVTEVSRLLASIPDVDVEMGKAIMTHLGLIYNRLMIQSEAANIIPVQRINDSPPASPASSGYYSDTESQMAEYVWRPW